MDFSGFKFNGYHSSSMNFVRTSNGSRYEENLIPTFQDKTVAVPGGDGTYFFDSFYTNRTFTIQIAFNAMTEANLRQLRQVFNTNEMGPLIFDETPYKAYTAKVQSPPQLKYICFDEDGARVYKGEGTIQFICYYPYARSVHKYLDEYTNEYDEYLASIGATPATDTGMGVPPLYVPGYGATYTSEEWIAQWKDGSGMLATASNLGTSGTNIKVYNPGDKEADFVAFYSTSTLTSSFSLSLSLTDASDSSIQFGELNLEGIPSTLDTYIFINSKTNLIEGCSDSSNIEGRTGRLYNSYIVNGDFFKIPISTTSTNRYILKSTGNNCIKLDYDYLYY